MDSLWYQRPLDPRAPRGGEIGVDGRERRGGEFEPFYVPRLVMPQLDESDYPAFLSYCNGAGVAVEAVTLPPSAVRPHQRVDLAKVRAMGSDALAKPILVSEEPFILDGHHRWAEAARIGAELQALRLSLSFESAVAFMFGFPRVYAYGDGQPHTATA